MKRYTVNLPDDVAKELECMAAEEERPQVEILRNIIKSEAYMRRKAKEGYGVQLVKDDSVIEVVFR